MLSSCSIGSWSCGCWGSKVAAAWQVLCPLSYHPSHHNTPPLFFNWKENYLREHFGTKKQEPTFLLFSRTRTTKPLKVNQAQKHCTGSLSKSKWPFTGATWDTTLIISSPKAWLLCRGCNAPATTCRLSTRLGYSYVRSGTAHSL